MSRLLRHRLLADLLDGLPAEGYPLGPGKLLQVEELLRQLPDALPVEELRTQLAPLFATTPEEQAHFYDFFNQRLDHLKAQMAAEGPAGEPVPETPAVAAAARAERYWRRLALVVLLALVAYAGFLFDPEQEHTWAVLAAALIAGGMAGWKLPPRRRGQLFYWLALPLLAAAGFGLKVWLAPPDIIPKDEETSSLVRSQRFPVNQGQIEVRNIQLPEDTAMLQTALLCDGQTTGETSTGSHYTLDSLGRFTFTAGAETPPGTVDSICATAIYANRRDTVYFIADILAALEKDTIIEEIDLPFPNPLPKDSGTSALYLFYWQYRWWLKGLLWLLLVTFTWALSRWYERRRARLVAEIEQRDRPPYVWRIETGEDPDIDFGENLALLLNRLRRRESGEGRQLDTPRTVQATVRKAGQVSFVYRQPTRPPEYLFLIDRYDGNDHRARLFDTLYRELDRAEVLVARYFYRGDPRTCFNENHPNGVPLTELLHRHRDARLLLVGEGRRLLSSKTGRVAGWTTVFEGWRRRVLLLTSPTHTWGRREEALAEALPVAPASLQGLDLALEQFESQEARGPRDTLERLTDTVREPIQFKGSLFTSLRRYFDERLIRWIAACAVYPALHWDLTLFLGRELSTEEAPLLTSDNLRQLTRLPWFIEGRMPEGARLQLLDYLANSGQETRVRQALDRLLRQTPPPEASVAYDDFRMNVVLNRLLLNPSAAERRELEREFERYLAAGKQPDFVTFKLLNREPTRLDLLVPDTWKKYLFRHEYPRFGWRPRPLLPGLWLVLAGALAALPVRSPECAGEPVVYQEQNLCLDSPEDRLLYLEHLTRDAIEAQAHERVDSLRRVAGSLAPADTVPYYRNVAVHYFNYAARKFNCTVIPADDCPDLPADSLRALACDNFRRADALRRMVKETSYTLTEALRLALPLACAVDTTATELPPEPAVFIFDGRVLDATTRQAIEGATVRAVPANRITDTDLAEWATARLREAGGDEAVTNSLGLYRLRLTATGTLAELQMQVSAPGYFTNRDRRPPADRLEDFRLLPDPTGRETTQTVTPEELAADEALKINTETSLRDYLQKFPQGVNAPQVRLRLDSLVIIRTDSLRRAEAAAWQRSRDANTAQALETFLQQYPEGQYAGEARTLLQQQQQAPPSPDLPLPAMVFIPGGAFTMGCLDGRDTDCYDDEKPEHNVTVKDFSLGRYEVTNEEFAAFLNDYGSGNVKEGEYAGQEMIYEYRWGVQQAGDQWQPAEGYEKHPVVYVTWYGANEYCRWLSQKTGRRYRLPTEAEWEYAARGGQLGKKNNYLYSGGNEVNEVAWYSENSGSRTHPVGQKKPNELGLYDMSGNVYEWCADWYGDYPSEAQVDPSGPSSGTSRVLRGGSWGYVARTSRSAYRNWNNPFNRNVDFGLRVARD